MNTIEKSGRIIVGTRVYRRRLAPRYVEALDPALEDSESNRVETVPTDSGSEMVNELRDSPAGQWEKYKQPIIVQIRNSYGLPEGSVKLLNPHVQDVLTAPQYGFMITGHVKFLPEPPSEIVEENGLPPYKFEAYISPRGDLVSSIRIIGSEG